MNDTKHSSTVGGSTAARVIACPASVALVAAAPVRPSSSYADEGTLLHTAIAEHLDKGTPVAALLGMKYEGIELTQDLIDEKLQPAIDALDEIDPEHEMEFAVEAVVNFGDAIPDAFGSADLIGRKGTRAYVIDHKFGSGIAVSAEESPQLMFYAAAAMRTPGLEWVFDGAEDIELIINQPPALRRWATSFDRLRQFEKELARAVAEAKYPTAKMSAGSHCKFCPAKPTCKLMTGAVDRALKIQLKELDAPTIGAYLANAEVLEKWIADLRALAHQMLEKDVKVPEYKLVSKRAIRQWVDEHGAARALAAAGLDHGEMTVTKLVSPAQAEKLLKKVKKELPDGLVVAVSSGSTLAADSDPRPAVLNIGKQLANAIGKLK